MIILHLIDVKNPAGNGVVIAVNNYTKYEKKYEKVAIFNLGADIRNIVDKNVNIFNYDSYNTISSLPSPYNSPDVVIFNEVYKTKYLTLYKECLSKHIPYIIIPHGCLIKNAQKKKLIKKKIGNLIFFKKFIYKSSSIQYLNENEKINSIYSKKNSIVSGNGITIPNNKNNFKNKDFVFIGRYDYKVKGLDLLIKMVVSNREWFEKNNVKVKLYGRTSSNGYDLLKKIINKCDLEDIIILNGAVYGKDKEKILIDSYAFIQVSRHEGQPLGIMEALSYGLPCIVTYGTSFGSYVNKNKCGIGINFNVKELFEAIRKMYSDVEYRNQCSNNTSCIANDYLWENVINKCIKEYEVLL